MTTSPGMRIAIVGAGVSGLTLAAELRRRGLEPQAFEQTAEMGVVGAALFLSANSIRLLEERLDTTSQLTERSFPIASVIHRDGYTGEVVAELINRADYEARSGTGGFGIHRAELQDLLLSQVGVENVHVGKRLTAVRDRDTDVVLTFDDGSEHVADFVIAADGARSVLRRHVVGYRDVIFSGCYAYRGTVHPDVVDEFPTPESMQFWMGDNGHALHYPIANREQNFLLVRRQSGPWGHEQWTAPAAEGEHLTDFAGWDPTLLEILGHLNPTQRWAMFYTYPLNQWSRGRITLMGDAAHAMLPHYGQGANTSMEDAFVLADLLVEGIATRRELSDVQSEFQALRGDRTRKIQIASAATADVLHAATPEAKARRNETLTRPGVWDHMLSWVHEFDSSSHRAALVP